MSLFNTFALYDSSYPIHRKNDIVECVHSLEMQKVANEKKGINRKKQQHRNRKNKKEKMKEYARLLLRIYRLCDTYSLLFSFLFDFFSNSCIKRTYWITFDIIWLTELQINIFHFVFIFISISCLIANHF